MVIKLFCTLLIKIYTLMFLHVPLVFYQANKYKLCFKKQLFLLLNQEDVLNLQNNASSIRNFALFRSVDKFIILNMYKN